MTRKSISEYAEALRGRYFLAGKAEKSRILNEFCKTTGYNRKSAIRLLSREPERPTVRRGRPHRYNLEVIQALKHIWEASDRICSKRLVPFMDELLEALERHGEMRPSAEVRLQLLALSAATVDRLLKPFREGGRRRPYNHSQASSSLKAQIPIRTFGDWQGVTPGSLQGDLVYHCGESTAAFYLTTLCAVDVATGWTELEAVWGKGQHRVGAALFHVRQRLPFGLREIHTDNGSEFLNEVLYPWCKREGIKFTRGRAYKKNDQAYVEQKNWTVVRRLVGYDRLSSKAAYEELGQLYKLVRLYVNFFQPLRKLIGKEREGSKVKKRFDRAQTPYQRVLAAGILTEEKRAEMEKVYRSLNPVKLRSEIDERLAALWKLAERNGSLRMASDRDKGRLAG